MDRIIHTPEGVRDIYGGECSRKLALQLGILQVFHRYGYEDIETPSFEYFEVFGKEVGTTPSRELYKFFDREGHTLVLRPDFTPSIARAAATSLPEQPVRRLCYTGNTFINNSSFQGRLKEVTQMGVELIGEASAEADGELIALLAEALLAAGLKEFQISVGQVEFFQSLLEEAKIDKETRQELRELVSDKNDFGVETLISKLELTPEIRAAFLQLPELFGSVEILEKARALTHNEKALSAIRRLEEIYEVLKGYGYERYVSFDLGMLSKYHYYTGIICQAFAYGSGEPIAKGGRYDHLMGHFGKPACATGFAISMDQLMLALNRQERPKDAAAALPGEGTDAKGYLTFAMTKGRLAEQTLGMLEKMGITCEEMKDKHSRKLIFTNEALKLKFFLAKGPDVPTYVEYGAADIGIVGKDTILEEGRKLFEVMDLGFGACRMCVCGPPEAKALLEGGGQIRVATKYPGIAKDYFYNQKHQTVEIIKLNGSIELAPIVGLSEVIVDIVETGSTLRENGLVVLEEICPLSARMVVNQVSMRMEHERIRGLIAELRAVLEA